jgi:hypothetical protein
MSVPTEQDFDWTAVLDDSPVEVRDTNVMPRQSTSTTGTSRTGTRRASGSRIEKRLSTLQSSLSKQMFQAGGMVALGLPVTGTYICQQSEPFPEAIIQLARKRADWLDALEKIADIGPGITVGRTILGIGASMGADRWHRSNGESGFSPDKRAAQFLGVTSAYYAVYKEDEESASQGYTPAPHPVYEPVS